MHTISPNGELPAVWADAMSDKKDLVDEKIQKCTHR